MNKSIICSLLLGLILFSCKQNKENDSLDSDAENKFIQTYQFQSILDSADVSGSILVFDEQNSIFYSNNFDRADSAFLPASTFKIPNSLIALETGVVENENSIIPWSGVKSGNKNWDKDLNFKDAFHNSCVPCYREIARKIGLPRMQEFLKKLNFGHMKIDSLSLDKFWLVGDSEISQKEQISFLRKFFHERLPISSRTYKIAKKMMLAEENNTYKILAKSGSTEEHLGWYVGYVEKKEGLYYFATNIEPKSKFDPKTRRAVTIKALESIDAIQ